MYEPESVWEFDLAGRVKFGLGASEELAADVTDRGASSVLVITDSGLQEAGVVDQVTAVLDGEVDYDVFADVEPDPAITVFDEAVEYARETEPDLIVGLGGGSSMDVAKTTSVVYEHGGDILEYVAEPTGEGKEIPGPGLPTICLPTTAGTGSETSPASVISLPERNLKVGISSRHQYPDLALVDPLLTVSLPPRPTASSGVDALCHAIGAYTTRRFDAKPRAGSTAERPDYDGRNLVTDQLARKAIELVGNNLRRAVNNGQDIEARRNMALGSFLAGAAFTNAGLGATHAMAMAIGAEQHSPHGETIATLLPAVMRYNATGTFDRSAEIAELLGEDTSGDSQEEAAKKAASAVSRLVSDVGLPEGLAELGVAEDEVEHLAEQSAQLERLLVGNPRRIDTADLEHLIRESL